MYKDVNESGYITVLDSMSAIYKIRIKDFKENDAWVTIPIKGKIETNLDTNHLNTTNYFVVHDEPKTFSKDNVTLSIPANTFYDDTYLDFDVSGDTLKIHEPTIPVKKNFTITYDISNYTEADKDKLFIANITKSYNKSYVNYTRTKKKGNTLTARTKKLGTYTLASDTKKPTITPINFSDNKWLSKYRYLKVKLKDDLSGIRNYRATVNGKWILMEYEAKKGILTHDFNDNIVTDTKNNLKIIVTDNVGNSTTFEATFFRK